MVVHFSSAPMAQYPAALDSEEIRFNALTYQKVFAGLMDSGQVGAEYKDYLRTRYFGEMV